MGSRSVIGMCVAVGSIAGGYVPTLWGASDFSVMSLLFSGIGGIAGVWLGRRLSEDL
jgi:phage tail tape-measure protein